MPKTERTYRQLQSELDEVMLELQSDGLDIEEVVQRYQAGLKLIRELENRLRSAKSVITRLSSETEKE